MPLPESDDAETDYSFDMAQPARMPMRPGPGPSFPDSNRPQPGRPPRPQPDRPQPGPPPRPQPDRPQPGRPPRPQPGRPQPGRPPRPMPPDRPFPGGPGPVRPDWSWNWGFVVPGMVFPVNSARVRFFNASVPGPIQIYVNNRPVATDLNFMNTTRYYNVVPGRYRITVYRGNNLRTPIVDTWMSFRQNTSTTVAVVGSGANFWLQTVNF